MIKEGNEGGLGALLKPGYLGKALKRWHSSGESRDEHGAATWWPKHSRSRGRGGKELGDHGVLTKNMPESEVDVDRDESLLSLSGPGWGP